MIVKYLWTNTAQKHLGFQYGNNYYSYKRTDYEGWFLFGVLPLYIRITKVWYS